MEQDFQLPDGEAAHIYESHVVQYMMKPFVAAMLKVARPQSDQALLDVACGTGIVARTAVANVPRLQAVGVDLNQEMLAVAHANDSLVTWEQATADQLPFSGGTFDIITCQQGMQFFLDAGAATMEMERVLALDGRVVATAWAPLDKNPYFRAQYEALNAYVDETAGELVPVAARADGDTYLKEAFIEGGLEEIEISLVEAIVDIPDVSHWAREQIRGLTCGAQFSALPDTTKEEFGEHFVDALAQYIGDDGVARVPFASWLASGRKL
jgi:ubiquinone/menaquinone biosynthesis C-methylase UbiE